MMFLLRLVVAGMHVRQAFSQSGDKCWNLLFVIIGEKHLFMQKMSMMLLVLAGERHNQFIENH
jgi:hypothetical protein